MNVRPGPSKIKVSPLPLYAVVVGHVNLWNVTLLGECTNIELWLDPFPLPLAPIPQHRGTPACFNRRKRHLYIYCIIFNII